MARTTERTVAWSELNLRGVVVQTTASATVYPSDSGITFVNTFAGDVTFTLPDVADSKGKMYLFVNADDQDLIVTSTAANIVVYGQTATTQQTSVTYSDKPGAACGLIGDGTRYLFLNFCGTEPDTLG